MTSVINNHLWFKRKWYGWYPAAWQGWLVTLGYIVLILLSSLTIDQSSSQREVFFTFFLPPLPYHGDFCPYSL